MARVVCQVVSRADRVCFIWSDGTASFEPYHLAAAERENFNAVAVQATAALAGGSIAFDLARLGHNLYRAVFRLDAPDGGAAQNIARWLSEQQTQGRVDSLEFLSDTPGRIPWALLLDAAPQPGKEILWESFWGSRINLAAGRRTNSLRFAGPFVQPTTLLAMEAGLLDQLSPEGRARLEAWGDERLVIDGADGLANQLRYRGPDLLVLLAPVDGGMLRLGTQRIAPAQLQQWIGEAREGNPNPVIFLGAAGTPEQASAWPAWLAAATGALDGLVTNEVPLAAEVLAQAALAFGERFVKGRQPLAAALADTRRELGASGPAMVAYCPPGLRTAAEPVSDAGMELPRQPLPEYPYCPLRACGPDYRPLFFGREEESLRLAALLDAEGTGGVVLHGGPGVGKTSLVQAGLWPYLEQECIGYRILCDRTPEETPGAEIDYPPLLLRTSGDLIGQLAEGLVAFCSQPLIYTTPIGTQVTVDLPAILAVHLGVPPSTAIQEPPAPPLPAEQAATGIAEPGHAPLPEPEPEPSPGAPALWLALREDPTRLRRLLDDITRQLPYELVLTIDQGEELLTLTHSPIERERRQQAVEMLVGLADSPARCKVVLILRTEYYGQLAGLLPTGAGRARWTDFFLDELDEAAMGDAVLGPTSTDEVLYSDEVPHNKYGFAYEEGLAQRIVDEVSVEARDQQHGVLSLLQVVCTMLYDSQVVKRKQTVIRAIDLKAIGGIRGALGRYVAQAIFNLPLQSGARDGLRKLVDRLTTRHADGRITRDLVPARALKDTWRDRTPVEQAVNTAADTAGLFSIEQLLVAGQPGLYVSLGHDAVAQAARSWTDDVRHKAAARKSVVDTLWIMIPLAMLAAAASFAITLFMNRSSTEAELKKQTETLQKEVTQFLEQAQEQIQATRPPLYRAQLALAEQALVNDNALAARQILLSEPFVNTNSKQEMRGFEWDYLWNRTNGERFALEGHLGTVTGVAVSADGRLAASTALDGTIRLWFLGRGLPAAIVSTGKALHAVALSPDGKTLAAAGADKLVRLWDLSALKDDFATLDQEPRVLRAHEDEVLALAFDKDGTTLASGGADKAVVLWDVKAGKARATLNKDHAGRVQALSFSPDGKTLASGGAEANVILWTADSGVKQQTLATSFQAISALAFAADGKKLAVGGVQRQASVEVGAVGLWEIKGESKAAVLPITAYHGRDVLALAYLPGGKAIASAGKDAVVRLWDAETGSEAGRWVGHLGWVTGLAFTHDGSTLVSGSYDRSVKAWDVNQSSGAQVLRGHKGWVQCLAMSSTGKDKQQILASGGKDGLVKLWDPTTGAPLGELTGHAGPVTAVAFAFAKSRMLAVGTWSDDGKGEIKLWELVREEKGTGYKGKELRTLKGHKGGVNCLAFSPAGDRLASGSADKTAILWDVEAGKAVHTLAGHQGEVRCLSFSNSGAVLLTGSSDKMARVWDTGKGVLIVNPPPFIAQTDSVEAIDFLLLPREEPGILTAGPDQLIRLWTLGKDKEGFAAGGTVRAAGQPITCVARQGNTLFTGGWDGTVRLWSIELRPAEAEEPFRIDIRERFTFAGHVGPVRAVVRSLDQTVLATAGHDGTIRLWRATSRRAAVPSKKDGDAAK